MIDRLINGAIALWIAILAACVGRSIGVILSANAAWAGLDYARLTSKICLLLFLGMAACLTILGRPVARAPGWQPRISALLGTNLVIFGLPFLTPRAEVSASQYILSAGLILAGHGLCVYTLSHLGRSFSILAEARKLVAHGPYAIIRHPLYLAEEIAILGIFIQYASATATILLLAHLAFQLKRIENEENVLIKTFPEYADYKMSTARILPGVW